MKNSYQELISKPEISFWVPIFITVASWVFSFGILYTKVDYIARSVDEQKSMWLQLEKRVGSAEITVAEGKIQDTAIQLRITSLETANNLKR